jgi:hypothetical protein
LALSASQDLRALRDQLAHKENRAYRENLAHKENRAYRENLAHKENRAYRENLAHKETRDFQVQWRCPSLILVHMMLLKILIISLELKTTLATLS